MLRIWLITDILRVSDSIVIHLDLYRNLETSQFGTLAKLDRFGRSTPAIVVGPSNKSYFYSVDQNWVNSNSWTGSPGRLVRHPYVSVTGFVRPPYSKDTSKPSSTDTSSASKANDSTITGEAEETAI